MSQSYDILTRAIAGIPQRVRTNSTDKAIAQGLRFKFYNFRKTLKTTNDMNYEEMLALNFALIQEPDFTWTLEITQQGVALDDLLKALGEQTAQTSQTKIDGRTIDKTTLQTEQTEQTDLESILAQADKAQEQLANDEEPLDKEPPTTAK